MAHTRTTLPLTHYLTTDTYIGSQIPCKIHNPHPKKHNTFASQIILLPVPGKKDYLSRYNKYKENIHERDINE
jgi:hypothetical protein